MNLTAQISGGEPYIGTRLVTLLSCWHVGAHDLTHLHQISRIMAHQLREAVDMVRFLA